MRVCALLVSAWATVHVAEGAGGGGAKGLGQGNVQGGKAQGLAAAQKVPVQAVPVQTQQQYVQAPMGQQYVQPAVGQPAQYTQAPMQQQQFIPMQQQQQQQQQQQYIPMQQQQPQQQQYVPVQQYAPVQQQQPMQPASVQPQQRQPASNSVSRTRGPARAKPCDNKPCLNGATCTNVRAKSGDPYTCVCATGWEGDRCDTKQTSIHLDADLMYKTEDGEQVRQSAVANGVVQPEFDAPGLEYSVDRDKVVVTLTNTGEVALDFKQPLLLPQHPDVLSPALVGGSRKGGRLGRRDGKELAAKGKSMSPTKQLAISHNCLTPGKSSKVQLLLQFQSGNVTFGWTVSCPKVASDGLTIVMKGVDEKVYQKGSVGRMFSPTSDAPYQAPGSKNVTSFILFACDPKTTISKGKGKKKGCPNPIAMNRPKVKTDYTAAASPVIIGQAAKGGTVDLATEVTVKHNCHDFGDAGITLTLNFKSYDPIVLSWRVSCYGGQPKGLTVTVGGDQAGEVVTDGVAAPAWAPDTSQTVIGADDRFTAFRIYSKNKEKKMTFQQAQVTADNENCNPGLSGQYWKGGSVGFKGGVNRLQNANLKKTNMKKIVEKVTGSAFGKQFIKDKEKRNKEKDAGQDRRLSQVDSHGRMWGEIAGNDDFAIVVEEEGMLSDLPEQVSDLPEGMLSDLAHSDRRRAAQSIVGGGWDNLADKAGTDSIVVTYNCVDKGSSLITLTIPFVMYDPIDLQWTKVCGGGAREFFTVRNMEKLVVEDGATLDHWHPMYAEQNGVIIDSADTETTFQIQMAEDPRMVQDSGPIEESYLDEYVDFFVDDSYANTGHAIKRAMNLVQTFGRPRVQSNKKGVCRPSLSGTARKGGTATTTPQDLTVKYHCLNQGEAIITLTIPVGIYFDVVFSFTKRCNRDAVKGFMMVPKGSSERVVTNGRAEKKYQAETVGGYVDISGMAVYSKSNKTAAFMASMSRSAGGITYLAPYARSDPPICEPRFDGDMAKGGILTPMNPQTMVIRFNCHTAGKAIITVRIEFEDDTLDAVQFRVAKDNDSGMPGKGLSTHKGVFKAIGLVLLLLCVLGACCVYWTIRAQRSEYNSSYAASSYTGGRSAASGSWQSAGGSSGGGSSSKMQPMQSVTSANEYS